MLSTPSLRLLLVGDNAAVIQVPCSSQRGNGSVWKFINNKPIDGAKQIKAVINLQVEIYYGPICKHARPKQREISVWK